MSPSAPPAGTLSPAAVPSVWSRYKERIIALLFVVPALVYVGVFAFYPAYYVVALSFRTPVLTFTTYNYTALVQQGLYQWIEATLIVTAGALALQFGAALGIAQVLTQTFRGKVAYTAVMILPIGVATVVGAYAFSWIFTTQDGYANSVLGLFGASPVDWLNPTPMAYLSIIVADSWKNFGLVLIILLAGYASIPRSLYSAAAIDGAGAFRRFLYVTLPGLRGYLVIALLIRGAQEFNIFQLAYIMVGSNPQLLTVAVYTNWQSSSTYYQGVAAASVLLGIIAIFIIVVIALGGQKK